MLQLNADDRLSALERQVRIWQVVAVIAVLGSGAAVGLHVRREPPAKPTKIELESKKGRVSIAPEGIFIHDANGVSTMILESGQLSIRHGDNWIKAEAREAELHVSAKNGRSTTVGSGTLQVASGASQFVVEGDQFALKRAEGEVSASINDKVATFRVSAQVENGDTSVTTSAYRTRDASVSVHSTNLADAHGNSSMLHVNARGASVNMSAKNGQQKQLLAGQP